MHLYVVAQGGYKAAASNLATEEWQTGLRYIAAPGSAPDAIGDLPADGDVYPVATTINRDETNWTIQGNWFLEMGTNDLNPGDWLNDQLAPAWQTFFGLSRFSSTAYVSRLLVYPINSTGRVAPAVPFSTGTPCTLTFKTEATCDGGGGGR